MAPRTRPNPWLAILDNPASLERAKESWGRFHLAGPEKSEVTKIDDIPGVPSTVVVLGAFEGGEFSDSRNWASDKETAQGRRDPRNGPWLVSDPNLKVLYVVAKAPGDLRRWRRFNRKFLVALYYYPGNRKSGKYHPRLAYRHAMGEVWADEKPKPEWAKSWPVFRFVNPRAVRIDPVRGRSYRIEPDGIVG